MQKKQSFHSLSGDIVDADQVASQKVAFKIILADRKLNGRARKAGETALVTRRLGLIADCLNAPSDRGVSIQLPPTFFAGLAAAIADPSFKGDIPVHEFLHMLKSPEHYISILNGMARAAVSPHQRASPIWVHLELAQRSFPDFKEVIQKCTAARLLCKELIDISALDHMNGVEKWVSIYPQLRDIFSLVVKGSARDPQYAVKEERLNLIPNRTKELNTRADVVVEVVVGEVSIEIVDAAGSDERRIRPGECVFLPALTDSSKRHWESVCVDSVGGLAKCRVWESVPAENVGSTGSAGLPGLKSSKPLTRGRSLI
jgi:hypothetical protein